MSRLFMVWMGGFAGAMAGGAIPQLTANVPIPVIPAIALFSAFSAFPPATLLLAGFGLGFVILRRHVSPKVLFLFSSLGSAVMVMAPYLIAKWPPINLSANQIFAWSPFLGGFAIACAGSKNEPGAIAPTASKSLFENRRRRTAIVEAALFVFPLLALWRGTYNLSSFSARVASAGGSAGMALLIAVDRNRLVSLGLKNMAAPAKNATVP